MTSLTRPLTPLLVAFTSLVAIEATAADTPEAAVREFYAAHVAGNVRRAVATLSTTASPDLKRELREEIEVQCIDVPSLRVTVRGDTVDAVASVLRTPRGGGPTMAEVERRTFVTRLEDGHWRIVSMSLDEDLLIDRLMETKTAADATALLAAHSNLVGPLLAMRLSRRSVAVAAGERPDRRLADLAYEVASMTGDSRALASAMAIQAVSRRSPGVATGPIAARIEEALRLARTTGDGTLIAMIVNALSTTHLATDPSSREGERLARETLSLRRFIPHSTVAFARGNLGQILFARGDYAAAYRALAEGIDEDIARGLPAESGFREFVMAQIMALQNDHELALELFRRALSRPPTRPYEILSRLGEARMLMALGRHDEARVVAEKTLAFAQKTPFKGLIGSAFVTLTELQIARGDATGAEATLAQAVAFAREVKNFGSEVEALLTMANLYLRDGRLADARRAVDEALTTVNSFEYPSPDRYYVLMLSARIARAAGDLDKALATYREAIDAIESARGLVAGGQRQQRLFFEPFHAAYSEAADLLLESGAVEEALIFAERGKGRVLLDTFGVERRSAGATLGGEDRRMLDELLAALREANRRTVALRASADATRPMIDAAVAEQRRAQSALDRFETDLAARDPRLRAVRGGSAIIEPSRLAAIVTRADFAILEFLVHDRATHLFVVERRGGETSVTAHRIEVTSAALSRVVDDLRADLAGRGLRYQRAARELYDLLLAPAAARLAGKRVLAIVPDGALWRVPFEVLTAGDGRMLVERAACFYVPSISVYDEMRARQTRDSRTGPMLAAFGNPEIEGSHDRLGAFYRSVELGPLPDAETEAAEVARLWGSDAVYTRRAAREDTARREMQRARIVHFAAHGIIDDASPMFSQIVLARGDAAGDDGVLQAWELMRLDLAADLVVLSACETARGSVRAGEGLIGLTWALLAGGCPSSVASHWKVSSRSTARLMVAFHRELASRQGDRFAKARALREAQLALLRERATAHPFHWAAFVLVGSAD